MRPANRRSEAVWWVIGQVVLLVVCVPFLWHACWTQFYFEPTDVAVTQASAHHPEFVTALVAILAAVVGGLVQILVKAQMRERLICLTATGGVVAALLAGGVVITDNRLPNAASIRATVYAVAVPNDVTQLPPNAVNQESDSGYPRIIREWQYGQAFLRSDVATADASFAPACAAIQIDAPASLGWHEEFDQPGYCSFKRTAGHVRLQYTASLNPGDIVPGQSQSETVLLYLEGDIAGPSNR